MILLHILGVNSTTIQQDYLLTNQFAEWFIQYMRSKGTPQQQQDVEAMRPILMADMTYLQGAYDAIDEHYGTIDGFVEQALDLGKTEIQQLRTLLLEH